MYPPLSHWLVSYRDCRFQCFVIKSALPSGTMCLLFMQDLSLCDFPEPHQLHISADLAKMSPFCGKIHQNNYWVNYFDLFGPLQIELLTALLCIIHSRGSQLNPLITGSCSHSREWLVFFECYGSTVTEALWIGSWENILQHISAAPWGCTWAQQWFEINANISMLTCLQRQC